MRIYSFIALLMLPLTIRSCQPQGLPTAGDLVRAREVITDSSSVIKKQRGYKGVLIIGDDPETIHGRVMKRVITGKQSINGKHMNDISIPEKNIVFFKEFIYVSGDSEVGWYNEGLKFLVSGEHERLRLQARVVHIPNRAAFIGVNDAARIAENNILFALSAGNTYSSENKRDLWSKEHPFWQGDDIRYYNNVLAAYKTGKVIAATSAWETEEGIIVDEEVVQCGDIAEWCFTVLRDSHTSGASARLAAMSFYLAQLYPTAEEIVETLNVCAIDIGEPG